MEKRRERIIEYLGKAKLPPGVTSRVREMTAEEVHAADAEAAALLADPAFQEEIRQARERGRRADESEPRAKAARYDRTTGKLVIDLRNGVTVMIPSELIQGLVEAPPEDIAQVEIWGNGSALHWEKLDADFTVSGLVAGIFGTKLWMEKLREVRVATARKAGSTHSPAKARASRENGKRGGRPRKATAIPKEGGMTANG